MRAPRHNLPVGESGVTRWSVIRGAAEGNESARRTFAEHYEPVIRSYLGARWQHSPLSQEIEDATQEVFFECFRGVLDRADPDRAGGFRALLYGVVRNVALRFEERGRKRREFQDEDSEARGRIAADEERPSHAFDRAWAQSIMEQAREVQAERASESDAAAERRCELLRLRFEEGTPIRDISRLWGVDAAHVHREYAKARREFKSAMKEVVRALHPGPDEEVEAECSRLLGFFSS